MAEAAGKTEISPELLKQVVNPFTLGADPEFVVLFGNTQIINSDPYTVRTKIVAGEIGHDHNGRVWELRPAPSPSSYGVVLNLWRLLKNDHMNVVSNFKWKSGALGGQDVIGGHVHYGLVSLSQPQLDCLAFVTEGLENLEILPPGESRSRRKTGVDNGSLYGELRSTRTSNGHIEYRGPASWLSSPSQAFATLTAYKLAATSPEAATWPKKAARKAEFENWIAEFSLKDVDAFLLSKLIERRGFSFLQADPEADFKPQWRKEDLWQQA